jgi:signal transduction histidine kinase
MNLTDWLPEHLQSWSDHPRASDLTFAHADDRPCWIEAQPALIGELVDILIENACKYSHPGSPIAVTLGPKDHAVALMIEDQGCGISEEDLAHVCEPFFRSEKARRQGLGGVGLGLAVARRLVEAFDGSLTIASQDGHGCRFTVSFPDMGSQSPCEKGAGSSKRQDSQSPFRTDSQVRKSSSV